MSQMLRLSSKIGNNALPMKTGLVPCVVDALNVEEKWSLPGNRLRSLLKSSQGSPEEQLGEVQNHNRHILDRVSSCCVPDPLAGRAFFFMTSGVQQKQHSYTDPDWCPQQEDDTARSVCRRSRNRTSRIRGS